MFIAALSVILVTIGDASVVDAQTEASCKFKLFELPPGYSSSPVYAVNDDGTVVGAAFCGGDTTKGFIRSSSGTYTYYSAPGTSDCAYNVFTNFTGRNDVGVNVGNYRSASLSEPEGFLLEGSKFTPFKEPNAVFGTTANGINNSNTVIGIYYDSQDKIHGFQRSSGGDFLTLDFPGAQDTSPQGINDAGEIVGWYYPGHGFTYDKGTWKTLAYPGASSTALYDISDAGVIVGNSNASKPNTAFLYEDDVFKVITVPNAYWTSVNSISADGVIVGMTNLDNTQIGWRGFTATCQ
jgi:uncharacterized membrane protein